MAFEKAQVNWLTFSYNTTKENFVLSMIHWDNFGFDAPENYVQETVIHNYTDGELGSETDRVGNERSIGKVPRMDTPAIANIPIPDQITDANGNLPIKAELMFTLQGGHYVWSEDEYISFNDKIYDIPTPTSENSMISIYDLVNTIRPYSHIIELDPNDLIQGMNEIAFYLDDGRLLNIHIELYYPIDAAPSYTSPDEIYVDHMAKLMAFWQPANTVGPGMVFGEINGTQFWTLDSEYEPVPGIDHWYIYDQTVSEEMTISIRANSEAQLAATGKAAGISYYEIWIDQEVVYTQYVNNESEVAGFEHHLTLDLTPYENGIHELFVQGYDVNGTPTLFDAFSAHAASGEYLPTIFEIQNTTNTFESIDHSIVIYPNPTTSKIFVEGLEDINQIQLVNIFGAVVKTERSLSNRMNISMIDMVAGVYFLKAFNKKNNTISYHKIVKE